MIELLAPAGDLERLKVALLYGADAVYVGGTDYSLRANAKNFNLDDLKIGVDFAHNLGKRVYVTVNIVPHNADTFGLEEYLLNLDEIGVDGIIVSDIYIMYLHRKLGLKTELHVSTQASTSNYESALFYKNMGAKRVVLARETSKEDIKRIKEETNLDLECFIHGAMCTSVSGRCVMSNYATNRDSNRGGCSLVGRYVFQDDDNEPDFTMRPKDLILVSFVKEMIEVGVNSFKVEGRMRSVYYIATVISVYRSIIDKIKNNTLTEKYATYALNVLNRCANRDSVPQFFDKLPGVNEQYFLDRNEISNQDFLGIVIEYDKTNGEVIVEQRNYFKPGDVVEIFGPNIETVTLTIPKIYDMDGNLLDVARHPKQLIKFKCEIPLSKMDIMRIKVFDI